MLTPSIQRVASTAAGQLRGNGRFGKRDGRFFAPYTFRCLLLAFLAIVFMADSVLAQQASVPKEAEPFHPTRIIVKYAHPVQAAAERVVLKQRELKIHQRFQLLPQLVVMDLADEKVAQVVRALPAKERFKHLQDHMAALRATGLVDYAEPDYVRRINLEPTDVAYTSGTLWAVHNFGQNNGVAGADIGAVPAWDITTGSTNVIVAIVDTGIRYTHQDLAINMWHNSGEIPGNGADDDGDGYIDNVYGINAMTGSGNPMDDNGHGSHVAGTIGAVANNGGPHVGVAWKVRLMACKFLTNYGEGFVSDSIKCLEFARSKGARIINASYGGPYFSQAEYDAIKALGDDGVLFVAAAGNQGNSTIPDYPASYKLPNVLAVVATDRNDGLASFSKVGGGIVQIGAPGVDIYSCGANSDSDYALMNGTSMAAPHVVGAAALVLSAYPDATLTELRCRLLKGATPIPALTNYPGCRGRLNVLNSLTATASGNLSVEVSPPFGTTLPAGKPSRITVTVSDLLPVTNALVTALISGSTNLTLLDNGIAPDTIAHDGAYTATITAPTNQASVNLNLHVSALGWPDVTNQLSYLLAVPPVNDDFSDRIAIAYCQGAISGSYAGASLEPGRGFETGARAAVGQRQAGGEALQVFAHRLSRRQRGVARSHAPQPQRGLRDLEALFQVVEQHLRQLGRITDQQQAQGPLV